MIIKTNFRYNYLIFIILPIFLLSKSTGSSDSNSKCDRPQEETFANASLSVLSPVPKMEFQMKYRIINSTVMVVFMDHGWNQADWDFYVNKFRKLINRTISRGKYTNIVLSPHLFADDPHFSISGIFLHVMTEANKNRSLENLPEIKVWLHLRAKTLYLLHEEMLVIPFLTNPLISGTLEGLLLEAVVLDPDPKKQWSWKGLTLYKKAVNSIRKVKLALLVNHYQCSLLSDKISPKILENFDVVYYYNYEQTPEWLLDEYIRAHKENKIIPEKKNILMDKMLYEDCKLWFPHVVRKIKVKAIQGVYNAVENGNNLIFSQIQLLM